jgi:chemotaxis protein CheX
MRAEHINPFIISTSEVFKTMVGVEPKKEGIFLRDDWEFSNEISGIIGLAGEANGFVVISLPEKLALSIYKGFTGDTKSEIDSDVTDAIGEILNMIAGSSKQMFSRMGVRFKLSIPSVILGTNHKVTKPRATTSVCIKFAIDGTSFMIEAALQEKK